MIKKAFFSKFINTILKGSVLKRRLFFFCIDILLLSSAMYTSFWLRFAGVVPSEYLNSIPIFILLSLACKFPFLMLYNLYDISWRFVSLNVVIKVFKAVSLGSLTMGMLLFILRPSVFIKVSPFPRFILFSDYVLTLVLLIAIRIAKRVYIEGFANTFRQKKDRLNILIVGAGRSGEQIIREMISNPRSRYSPFGLVDDDPKKQRIEIHGVKVLGTRNDIPRIINNYRIDEVLIAIPSAHSKDIRNIVGIIRETSLSDRMKILPSTNDLINGKITLTDIREVELADLLGRDPVRIDYAAIKGFLKGKRALITGAGGSIGSELARSVLMFDPSALIVLDLDETELFNLMNRLDNQEKKIRIIPVIADIKDRGKIEIVFKEYKPDVVFHAAAYKHVPILESFPEEAVLTNIFGTWNLVELSIQYKIERFVFISTDKAINPSSVMGVTKRVGEELVKALNQNKTVKTVSVRFGNVLGSRGNVIQLFREQIKKGGPVTVTHPEMKRYFMMTSEAVLLVLEAAALGEGGEVFVLDMGEPINILELAREMIRLSGYSPDSEIPIVFTRVRPGEKLFEEILRAEEGVEATPHKKIFRVKTTDVFEPQLYLKKIRHLFVLCEEYDRKKIKQALSDIIPTYHPDTSV